MRKLLKDIIVLSSIIITCIFCFSCEKEDSVNKDPIAPTLLEPSNNSVINEKTIKFTWRSEESSFTHMISKDSINWHELEVAYDQYGLNPNCELSQEIPITSDNYYVFDDAAKYFWKVRAEKYEYDDGDIIEVGASYSETFSFFTGPANVNNLQVISGHENVKLLWEDSENMDYVEITFNPVVSGINQPIKVEKEINELQINELENGEIYSFYLKTYNKLNHASTHDTIRAMPLDPTQVHDADFNIYNLTQIGDQVWLRENLKTTKWQDGTTISSEYYQLTENSDIYGYYYRGPEIMGTEGKNPCPCGFHVPSDDEWKQLESYLGMPEAELNEFATLEKPYRGVEQNIGNILKSKEGWQDYEGNNGNGTDFYLLNIVPVGFYNAQDYAAEGMVAMVHTSTIEDNSCITRIFRNGSTGIARDHTFYYYDASIRCIKNK